MSDLLNSASLVMIPSGYKEDVVYSQIPTDGSGDLSFTRASNGTRVNSAGLVEVVPWNLLQQSETFNVSPWVNENNIVTSNSIVAPNGTTTADTISNSNTTALFRTYEGAITGYAQPQTLTFSTYFKYKDHRYISFGITDDVDYRSQVVIDLQNMVITENYKTNSGDVLTSSIESVGNGWYRIVGTLTYNTALAGGNLYFLYKFQNSGTFYGLSTAQTGTGFYMWGAQLNIGSTAKPYFPTTDRLNVPRLTYQNGGGGCPSLLLEKQSTNLVTYSQDFSNAAWNTIVNSGCSLTITPNYTTASNGLPATRLVASRTNTSTLAAIVNYVPNTSTNATKSIWMKNNNSGNVTIMFGDEAVTITDSWERYSVTNTYVYAIIGLRYSSVALSCDISMTGYQFELGSYPTSYIPTTSSSATRVADECFKTGISSLIGQTEGVIFFDGYFGNETDEMYAIIQNSLGNSTTSSMYLIKSSSSIKFQSYDSSTTLQWEIQGGSYTIGQRIKIAGAYKANDIVLYVNGVQIGTDTSATIATCTALQIGVYPASPTANFQYNGKVNEVVLFPTRLTNAELASLTTI